ncbi:FAD binding domain-containing protein [Goodfellowiella coeruleoviolacea]|uniref:Xanthine dehydrogenase YagS FAD-binding subunit n=1 Tax=Goodfellowiella coeruleoviolacea TaxID=334858 RepID=A0AAE3KJH4_9PSEU|nr:xanthine dehydrogenase family protein subunit M [Goodfellowiella coeruleoviolacea]MCP2169087.1 xanthine dehydrogenase YagS FAD-binding subunit [Goodfellowiella coeruleoviolacea]
MKPFTYQRPADPADAAELLLAQPDAVVLAGGTNLVDLMKLGVLQPGSLVDVSGFTSDRIEHRADGGVLIGAGVRNADLAGDLGVRQRFPVLAEALLAGASGQLRSMATTGGNLLQRTRCAYFQDVSKPCNKREPGSGCAAITGQHRDLGVIGTSDKCVATHPSDMAVALAALDAVVHLRRADGEQVGVPLSEFYLAPGDTPERETIVDRGDLVTGVELPPAPAGARMRYHKVRDRASFAFAVVSVAAVVVRAADGTLADVRIALGGVAPMPWRARVAEAALRGQRPEPAVLRAAAQAEFAAARPLPDNAFKVDLAIDLITATIADLGGLPR